MRSVTISRDKFQAATTVKIGLAVYSKAIILFQQDVPTGYTLGENKQTKYKSNSLFNLVLMLLTHIF